MKKFILTALLAALAMSGASAIVPHRFEVPDIPGYQTLLGDFHIHTTFSDGTPWPADRVHEANYDGLDVLSITDHVDTRHRKMVKKGYFVDEECDQNTSYELAAEAAKKYGLMVVHGAELTRGLRLFAGHFNTHFISDGPAVAAAAETEDAAIKDPRTREEAGILNGLREARRQGAFITFNHPNWYAQAPNGTVWLPIHERVFKEGLMDGIEIVNHWEGYSPEAFHWALERNLAIVSGTDSHEPMNEIVDYEAGEYRAMTLIFAKERSQQGVREALDARRTAVCYDGFFYGREDLLKALFFAGLEVRKTKVSSKGVTMYVRNTTSVPIYLKKSAGSETLSYRKDIKLSPGEDYTISIAPAYGAKRFEKESFDVHFSVLNYHVDAGTPLEVSYHFDVAGK